MSQIRFSFAQFSWALSLKLALITGFFAFVHPPQVIFAQGIPQRWEATEYQPQSGIGKPKRIAGAGTRGATILSYGCQLNSKIPLTALVPENGFALTVSAQPTFYVYVPERLPQGSLLQVEFHLKDKNDIDIYQTSFLTVGKPGIVAITLPNQAGLLPLEIGQDYKWSFSIGCSGNDHSNKLVVENLVIRRIELNATLTNQLKQASPQKQVELYATAGIWQESLSNLMQLKRENPNNSEVDSAWRKLLKSVALENISQQSLVEVPTNPES